MTTLKLLLIGDDLGGVKSLLQSDSRFSVSESKVTETQRTASGNDFAILRLDEIRDNGEAVIRHLTQAGVPFALVRSRLEPTDLTKLMLVHPTAKLLLDDISLAALTAEQILLAAATPQPGQGIEVGSIRLAHTDAAGYNASRFLSLNSPSMSGFLVALRVAIDRMSRARPEIPWDPRGIRPPEGVSSRTASRPGKLASESGKPSLADIMGRSESGSIRQVLANPTDRGSWAIFPPCLLLTGESGTGKTLVASLVHNVLCDRDVAPDPKCRPEFVAVTAAGMRVDTFDIEMHGSSDGAHTDTTGRVGKLAQAAYGTLFFDEFGEMPLPVQERVRTIFNDLMVTPIQGEPFFSFAHIIAATNRDLSHAVSMSEFKHDLLARFGAQVELPPLRSRTTQERRELVDFVAQDPNVNPYEDGSRPVTHIEPAVVDVLADHPFTDDNFRGLERVIHDGIWRARREGLRTLRISHIKELEPSRLRLEREHRIVDVVGSTTYEVRVSSDTDLYRLADRVGGVIVRDGHNLRLRHEGMLYTAIESNQETGGPEEV